MDRRSSPPRGGFDCVYPPREGVGFERLGADVAVFGRKPVLDVRVGVEIGPPRIGVGVASEGVSGSAVAVGVQRYFPSGLMRVTISFPSPVSDPLC